METVGQDVKYALRSFKRQPAFALTIVLALAIGIGANTTIFSVVNSVLLHPLYVSAWEDPGRVMMLWEKNASLNLVFANQIPVRPRNYRAWREQAQSFDRMAAWRDGSVTITDGAGGNRRPERIESGTASAELFPLMGVRPRLGRNFLPEETRAGTSHVAILSDELYRSRFNSHPNILAVGLILDGKPYRVVGVLPPDVAFPAIWGGMEQKKPKIWIPLDVHPDPKTDETSSLFVLGRLKVGVSSTSARAEMHVIESRLANTPLEEGGFGINLLTLAEGNTDPTMRRAVMVLQIAVAFVLLIACANAANLLLSRAVAREREIAVRSALGASGFRVLRQNVTESLILSIAAALLGTLFSLGAIRVLAAIAPPDSFALQELRIDRDVFAFTAAVGVGTGVLFGLVPAYHSRQRNISGVISRGGRGVAASSNKLRSGLVIAETALSLVLVMGAGLMIRSLGVLMNTNLGFQIDHLIVMRLALSDSTYTSPQQVSTFDNRLLASVRNLARVQSAALTTALPMKAVSQSSFEIPGRSHKKNSLPVTEWARVSDGYFETLHIPILGGRAFTREEALSENPSTAVVNQAFAKAYFPSTDPLAKLVTFGNEQGASVPFRIVGVVGDEHQMGPDNEQSPELYLPGHQMKDYLLVARTEGDPSNLAGALKQQVWNLDKAQPVTDLMTEEAALREWSAPRRFNMTVLVTFAIIAALLAAMGLYSVVAYTVNLRTREIGIRMAIGSQRSGIVYYILRAGLMLAGVGIAVGVGAAFALTRFMSSLIYGVGTFDLLTFIIVLGTVAVIAIGASFIPALRAANINPIEALRFE